MRRKAPPDFDVLRERIISDAAAARAEFYRAEVFGGPSLYFHECALTAARELESRAFAKAAYAVLASWGMHRMGSGGSKMVDFGFFAGSIDRAWPAIRALQQAGGPEDLDAGGW